VSRGKVSAMMVCLVCGGLGHASNVDGMQCLTAQLGIKVPKHDLAKIKYPNGIKFPEWSRRPKSRGSGASSSDAMYSDKGKSRLMDKRPKPKFNKKDKGKQYKQREAKEVQAPVQEDHSSESSSESDQEQAPESKFASVYHTIDIRPPQPRRGRRCACQSGRYDDNGNYYEARCIKRATHEAWQTCDDCDQLHGCTCQCSGCMEHDYSTTTKQTNYQSYSSDSDSDRIKSATTKARAP